MNEALPKLSNGYDQYNDTDINRARFIFSIEAVVLIPFNISINLLTIIVIFVFKRLQTIQNTFVASMAFGGLLDGLIANPLFAIFWLPDNTILNQHDKHLDNKYLCITYFVAPLWVGMGSILSLTMVTADRFFAVMYPFRYVEVMSLTTARRIVIVFWILCSVYSFLPYVWNGWHSGECSLYSTFHPMFIKYMTPAIFLLGLLSSFIFDVIVFRKAALLKENIIAGKHLLSTTQLRCCKEQARRSLVAILLYAASLICFGPHLVMIPLRAQLPDSKLVVLSHTISASISNLHFSFSTIVYILVKKQTREAIGLLLKTCPWKWSTLKFHLFDVDFRSCRPTANTSKMTTYSGSNSNSSEGDGPKTKHLNRYKSSLVIPAIMWTTLSDDWRTSRSRAEVSSDREISDTPTRYSNQSEGAKTQDGGLIYLRRFSIGSDKSSVATSKNPQVPTSDSNKIFSKSPTNGSSYGQRGRTSRGSVKSQGSDYSSGSATSYSSKGSYI